MSSALACAGVSPSTETVDKSRETMPLNETAGGVYQAQADGYAESLLLHFRILRPTAFKEHSSLLLKNQDRRDGMRAADAAMPRTPQMDGS